MESGVISWTKATEPTSLAQTNSQMLRVRTIPKVIPLHSALVSSDHSSLLYSPPLQPGNQATSTKRPRTSPPKHAHHTPQPNSKTPPSTLLYSTLFHPFRSPDIAPPYPPTLTKPHYSPKPSHPPSHSLRITPAPRPTPTPIRTPLPTHHTLQPLDLEPILLDSALLRLGQVVRVDCDFRPREPFPRVDVVVGEGAEPDGRVDDDGVVHVLGWWMEWVLVFKIWEMEKMQRV